jgi:hypothetical protein
MAKRAARLPSGKYAWKGRAVPFAKLPKAERSRFRSAWGRKGAKTRKKERAGKWLKRRTVWTDRQFEHAPKLHELYPKYERDTKTILSTLGPDAVLAARTLQKAAHRSYVGNDREKGGRALEIADQIRDALGKELAQAMPQLWWYH